VGDPQRTSVVIVNLQAMSSRVDEQVEDPRVRAARTKRDRTRTALITAADAAFAAHGWAGTRIEDIATAADVSVATAYNHFPTKHALLAAVYGPHVNILLAQAERDIEDGRPIVDALTDQIDALARLSWRHRGLTAAFTAAVLDYTVRVGRPADPADEADPRVLAPLPESLRRLIERGQATGELHRFPPAVEISGMIINLLLLRSINRDERPEITSALLLKMLFGALRPELVMCPDSHTFHHRHGR
jgi:AcrR family transcriptional regulator